MEDKSDLGNEIEEAKRLLGIAHSNSDMTDDEIKAVARAVGELASDTTYDEDFKPKFGNEGISLMICVTLYYFPKYFEKYGLAQFN